MKQIEQYNDAASYNAAGKPTAESRVANIKAGNISEFDGVNVPTTETPTFGDAVYLDENGNKVAIRKDVYNRSLVPASWTYKGVFLGYYKDGRWRVFLGNYASLPSYKYADVLQYALTAITDTSLTLKLRIRDTSKSGDAQYGTNIDVPVTLTSTAFNATTVSEINVALAEKAAQLGDTNAWWCYLANDDDEKVDTGATRIIVQCDVWSNYQQYNCGCTGGTLTFSTWGDMPLATSYLKVNGKTTGTRGIMNFAGAVTYWGTNGRTLAADVAVHSEAGSTDPMKLTEFQTSPYASEIRAYYKTYEAYLRGEFGILAQMKVGVFGLPDGEVLTAKYGPRLAPTKAGSTKAKFPTMNWAYNQGGHLWDVMEGVTMLEDANLAIINGTQSKAGKVTLANSSSRWFAQRTGVITAWHFYGTPRALSSYGYVYGAYQAVAVTLL